MTGPAVGPDPVAQLRAAGCVFAEEEAAILREWAADAAALAAGLARRVAGEPLEHIVGYVQFGGLRLRVGPGVFVPRQRSMLLADTVIELLDGDLPPMFAEVCCGAAPIAATVHARRPHVRIYAGDIDPGALAFARLNLPSEAVIGPGPGLSGLPAGAAGALGVIAAVPPYVPEGELRLLPGEALDHEPLRALTAGADGLAVAGELLDDARRLLTPRGAVALEMHRDQAPVAAELAAGLHYRTRIVDGDDGQTAVLVARRLSP